MNEEDLKKIFDEMSALVEFSFNVSVEEIYGAISFWTPTPDDEVEELELFGIIDIGDQTTAIQKIIHLTHEAGHVIYTWMNYLETLTMSCLVSPLAWYLGYHFMAEHGYIIDMAYL